MKIATSPDNQRQAFSSISIIFNPNSTGDGKSMAKELKADLHKRLPGLKATVIPTRHAGHAEELAHKLAKESKRPLIISASGDGGYNEVVNGIVKANQEGAHAVAGLLPAGNANDHYHDAHQDNIASLIIKGKVQKIDLIKLDTTVNGKAYTRFAHSYIGFGLTPLVGRKLNQVDLNWFNEKFIAIKTLFTLRPITIFLKGKRRKCDSIVFSNVSTMSKVLSLSSKASNSDGLFEVTIFEHRRKRELLYTLLKASTIGLTDPKSVKEYHFRSIKQIFVQLDGEIAKVDANSEVEIKIDPKTLDCIV
jgi:diacylglycerol kinase (ATP)